MNPTSSEANAQNWRCSFTLYQAENGDRSSGYTDRDMPAWARKKWGAQPRGAPHPGWAESSGKSSEA
jgi:hypothetical protein